MMTKCRSGETARAIASDQGLSFGWSVHNGAWYVGTPAELAAIGCADVGTPSPARTPAPAGPRVELRAGWGFWEQSGNGERFRRATSDLAGELVRVISPRSGAIVRLDDGTTVRADVRALELAVAVPA